MRARWPGDGVITVAILINGNPIMARSATNQMERNDKDQTKYVTDCGQVLWHHRDDGAIPLAKTMLDAIKEDTFDTKKERK